MDERIAIAGSGAIACGLAAAVAAHGDVLLLARSDDSAQRAATKAEGLCERLGADGTFVIEAIVEDQGSKGTLLSELNGVAGPDAILATTTSSLPIEALAA